MSYTPLPNPWKGIPLVGSLIDNIQNFLAGLSPSGGSVWYTGAGAPSAGLGANGDLYLNTSNGDIYQKAAGSWGSPIENITGPTGATGAIGATGPAGTNGATWYTGAGAPSAGTGVDGDLYYNTSNGDIYKKTAGSWGSPISNITGPTGPSPGIGLIVALGG